VQGELRGVQRVVRSQRRDERGAALVEFAIVIPLLLLLTFGIVEFGMAFNAASSVSEATRAGGRTGAILSSDPQMEYKAASATATALDLSPGSLSGNPTVCVSRYHDGVDPCNDSTSIHVTLVHVSDPGAPTWEAKADGRAPNDFPNDPWTPSMRNFGCPVNGQPGTFDRVIVRLQVRHELIVPGLFGPFFGHNGAPALTASSVFQLEPVTSNLCSS